MVRTQIQLTEAQYSRLKECAREENVSMAELVRQAVDLLTSGRGLLPGEDLRRRAMAVTGGFVADRDDVSERHDDYYPDAIVS
jgi:hypothetical protein